MTIRNKLAVLFITSVMLMLAIVLYGPIPQDLQYHQFADTRSLGGIVNAWNVISNITFLVIGLWGLVTVQKNHQLLAEADLLLIARVFFIGLTLITFGSAYYHLDPSNETLMWDRLPMSLSFMAFFCFILVMHIDKRRGLVLLWPLLGFGLFSVLYWGYTESIGEGDLRFYVVVQFLPMVLIPMILVLFPVRSYQFSWIWWIIGLYGVAKLLELSDQLLYDMIFISGHTLKHVVVPLAGIAFVNAITSAR